MVIHLAISWPADSNADINTHIIGYSRFLRLFSVFSHSDIALTAFQYLFVQTAGLYFLFTLFFFHNIGRVIQIILLGFVVINPMFLYMANMVSSDCIFLGLSPYLVCSPALAGTPSFRQNYFLAWGDFIFCLYCSLQCIDLSDYCRTRLFIGQNILECTGYWYRFASCIVYIIYCLYRE